MDTTQINPRNLERILPTKTPETHLGPKQTRTLHTDTAYHLFAISSKGFIHVQPPHSTVHVVVDVDGTLPPNCCFGAGPIDSLSKAETGHVAVAQLVL